MLPNRKIDWAQTHKGVVKILADEKLPWHYKQLYHKAVRFSKGLYSENTKPIEKFRQYYAEHRRETVGFIPGGYLVLRRWFVSKSQLHLFPSTPMVLKGNCIVSYEAGYEQAMRQPHMKDHFNDAHTPERHERRRRASLVETHIKHYFATNYAEFYAPPTNRGKYELPAKEDFFLCLLERRFPVDIKSWSYERGGKRGGWARNPGDGIMYLWGDWQDDDTVLMNGICSGSWLKTIGEDHGDLVYISDNSPWPIECLLVMLNMARAGMDYIDFKQRCK